ncbi:MAG: peptidyl-prolyl cis-trans isomerase [Planctomycetaceae bacterium]
MMNFRSQHRLSSGQSRPTMLALAAIMGLSLCGGCKTTTKADNPVVGPRPPRISEQLLTQLDRRRSQDAEGEPKSGVVQASGDSRDAGSIRTVSLVQGNTLIEPEAVAARVNGRPIFVSEVMEPYQRFFREQGAQLSEQELSQARRQILEKDLDQYIEQAIILDAARAKFKQEQWDTLQTKLDEIFYSEEMKTLQAKLKASTTQEVEAKLQEEGSSLAAYRRVWGDRQVAGQWIGDQIPAVTVSRHELLEEYEARRESYREPEQVKWQQCTILNAESGGQDGATQRVQKVIQDLKAGRSFDEVVETHSDPGGGMRDWTQTSSLADERLRDTLVSLKVNQLGPVIEDDRGFRLVKLLGYRPERVTPFEEVQTELREQISQRKRSSSAEKVIEDLRAKAHIETLFDPPSADL